MEALFFNSIFENLKSRNIFVDTKTIQPFKHQGWMSSVFIAESNIGKLVIHSANLVNEHKRNLVWEKFKGLAPLLDLHQEIPTSNFCYIVVHEGNLILAQKFINGIPCGKRILKQGVISDQWTYDQIEIVKKVLNILADTHNITLKGFGWPILNDEQLNGKYKTWQGFLATESVRWVETINQTDQKLGSKPIKGLEKSINILVKQINYAGPAVLAHGDAINPSNILLKDNKEIALIDWEWSIAADPAWEFCDLGWWELVNRKKLSQYFETAKIVDEQEITNFLNRIKLYIPLWLLWGTHMHAEDISSEVYQALRLLLIQKIN